MKRVDRYITASIIKTTMATLLLMLFVLLLFDIFTNLDRYLNNNVSYADISQLALLYAPQAIVIGLGPSLLFSTTYFLSTLHANNELIILYNAGFSFKRIILPCILLGIVLSIFLFLFNERIAIPASREKELLTNEVFNIRTNLDNRNVTLQSSQGNYIFHTSRYFEKDDRITGVVVVMLDPSGRISARINATSGRYNGSYWILQDVTLYLLDVDGKVLESSRQLEYHNERLSMEPGMFRNLSADIRTMELGIALQYVSRLKTIDSRQHAVYASDLYNRIFNSLTPLILIIISCSTVVNWKKNVLVFSIIASLSIAIVFYVMQMLSMILAKQGVIHPILGPLLPMVVLLVFSIISSTVIRK